MYSGCKKTGLYQELTYHDDHTAMQMAEQLCVGCGICTTVCPIIQGDAAKRAYSIKMVMEHECISCGACMQQCKRKAIDYQDDTQEFIGDLLAGMPISLLAAPAVHQHFDDYRQVFGFLKSLGVQSFHNVLLRADITIWAYLQILQQRKNTPFISSPCAAVTSYITKHFPALQQYLMPIYSPMICTGIYLKKYQQLHHKLAFLSPCIGKKAEMSLGNITTPLVHYNVTISKLKAYILSQGIDLKKYETIDFNDKAEGNGQTLGFHGGVCESLKEYFPAGQFVKISGTHEVYDYLTAYEVAARTGKALPTILEVYNCTLGCDGGTGTGCYQQGTLRAASSVHQKLPRNVPVLFTGYKENLELTDFIWQQLGG